MEGNAQGLGSGKYYGYTEDLCKIVESNLNEFGIDLMSDSVFLVSGLLQNTLQPTKKIAFAHIDVDWFEPVAFCLERIYPNLVIGGVIIIDDYFDWDGCRLAVDSFLANKDVIVELDASYGSLKITKNS